MRDSHAPMMVKLAIEQYITTLDRTSVFRKKKKLTWAKLTCFLDKMKRLKEAKSEARVETEQFQKEHEEKFSQISKSFEDGKMSNEIEKQVNDTIKQMDLRVKAWAFYRIYETLVFAIYDVIVSRGVHMTEWRIFRVIWRHCITQKSPNFSNMVCHIRCENLELKV